MPSIQRPDAILFHLKSTGKKHLLQRLSEQFADATGLDTREIFDRLFEREKLGSTGLGDGIAIPHARHEKLDRVYTIFATMDGAVDFEALDERPVDLIFALMAPQEAGADHLQALASASRLLRSKEFCDRVRGATSVDAVESLIINSDTLLAA